MKGKKLPIFTAQYFTHDWFFSMANTTDSLAASGLGSHRNWLQGLDSPLIQPNEEESGQKELKLRFDVSQYSPEEIVVKTVDNKLLVRKLEFFLSSFVQFDKNKTFLVLILLIFLGPR